VKTNIKTFFTRRAELVRRIDSLRAQVLQLEEKVKAAQAAKTASENRAEELRKDKERLRAKIADQKKLIEKSDRIADQLRTKCEALEKTIEEMRPKRRN
jgi:chromosome segregation ATPase